jgi:AcrR family transcriptional regulator
MPRVSDETREQRRQHILTSAWRCFSRDGFHATSIEDVIAATGMSSSAVYRYFRSKEEIVRASAEIGAGWPCRPRPRRCAIRSYTSTPAPATATRSTTA